FDLTPKLTLGAGAGVLTASLPLWLPAQPGVPWWAWGTGGIGLVTAGIGLKLALDAGSCVTDDFGRCTQSELATGLGSQLMLQSVPFLALPLVYAIRSWTHGRVSGQLGLQAAAGRMRV